MRIDVFSKKTLRVEIQTTNGEFIIGTSRIINIVDLPMEVSITKVFGAEGLSANVKIYGVSKNILDAITRLKWQEMTVPMKAIRIFADDGNGEKLLYEGNIMSADPMYNAPNIYVNIQSNAGAYYNMLSDIPPSSLNGTVPVPDIFKKIANDFGVGFKNNGVVGVCKNPYFNQDGLFNRIRAAEKAYDVSAIVYNNFVEIFPKPNEANIILLKNWTIDKNYYVGYPKFTDAGVNVTLDVLLDMNVGDMMTIKDSDVTLANGEWQVLQVKYNLSTKIGGKWFMTVDGSIGNVR